MTSARGCVALLAALLAFPAIGDAHRLDEYLQATLVDIEPSDIRLQINLTPGVAVAERVLAAIDRDGDGVISSSEAAAYAEQFKRDLVVRLDNRLMELKLAGSNFPQAADLRSGWGIIQLEFSIVPGTLSAGAHSLAVENRHMPGQGAYLLNAAQPRSESIRITRQQRNEIQSVGEIEFAVHASTDLTRVVGIAALLGVLLVAVIVGIWPRVKVGRAKRTSTLLGR